MNQIRSLLLERGQVVPQGRAKLAAGLADLLDGDKRTLAPRIHALIEDMRRQLLALASALQLSMRSSSQPLGIRIAPGASLRSPASGR